MYFRRITTTRYYPREVNQQIIAEKGKSVERGYTFKKQALPFCIKVLKSGRLREEDIVFQVDMLVKIVLKLLKLLVRDREGVADILRQRIPIGKVTDGVNGIADLLMLTIETDEGCPDRFHISGLRRIARYSGGVDPLDGRKEHLLFLAEMGRHIGGYPGEDGGDLDHLRMVAAMYSGNLVGVGRDLRGILVEIGVVGIDDVIGQKRQRPGGVVLAALDRRTFHGGDFPQQCVRGEPPFPADSGQWYIAAAAEVNAVFFKDPGGAEVVGDQRADGWFGIECHLLKRCFVHGVSPLLVETLINLFHDFSIAPSRIKVIDPCQLNELRRKVREVSGIVRIPGAAYLIQTEANWPPLRFTGEEERLFRQRRFCYA